MCIALTPSGTSWHLGNGKTLRKQYERNQMMIGRQGPLRRGPTGWPTGLGLSSSAAGNKSDIRVRRMYPSQSKQKGRVEENICSAVTLGSLDISPCSSLCARLTDARLQWRVKQTKRCLRESKSSLLETHS